ncbi:Involucrin repeat protein [Coniochaeta hoffmannii]|uniref:Involucrin repeat protein n=1 Tax=Coniochaeta hoffmannii TaxID=91930 RepID=A0AA38VPP8_9PEZI|nr:Involucrin repeat protein [Coniochaeta hoffmannii]
MSASDKRRVPAPGSGSPSRVTRRAAPNGSPPSSKNAASRTSNLLAPPPRVALSGSSSPTPDDHRNRESGGGGSHQNSGTNMDTGGQNGNDNNGAARVGTPQALREKDERIAFLERELRVMETQFQRELDKLSANESETASFWQAKHSALNQQFLRTDTELRLLRAEVDLREAEREELRTGYETMRQGIRERDDEIRDLRAQVRGLKEWVSNSTRSDGQTQTSDEVFCDGMARLGNGLQNWVIVNFRRAKLDLSRASESTLAELNRLVPSYEELISGAKIHLIQSVVSRILVGLVFDVYFVGLSAEQSGDFAKMEQFLAYFASSAEPVNQWRSSTLTILKREAATKMQGETSRVTESVLSHVNAILDSITDAKSSDTRDQGLRTLIGSAIELSQLLVVQKAVLKVYMPQILPYQKTTFDPATMEDIGGEDEESLADREICCVTFPGIVKRGDENGGQLQYRNVISKARVLCSPE